MKAKNELRDDTLSYETRVKLQSRDVHTYVRCRENGMKEIKVESRERN